MERNELPLPGNLGEILTLTRLFTGCFCVVYDAFRSVQ